MANLEEESNACPLCGHDQSVSSVYTEEKGTTGGLIGRYFAMTVAGIVIVSLGAALSLVAVWALKSAWGLVF